MAIYLSRLILNARVARVRRDVSDVYQLHRTVLAAFPQVPDGASARDRFGILYRIEALDRDPWLFRLLVQSQEQPDWSRLPAQIFGPAPDERGNPAVRRVDEDYARIKQGARFFFRLRANPTRRLSNRTPGRDDPLAGKRVTLLREEEQLAWLERKGERHGFRLLRTQIDPRIPAVQAAHQGMERGRRRAHDHPQNVVTLTFGATLFTGHLEVTDAERFRAALTDGIGSGKAFGFGLLSIASLGSGTDA